MDPALGSLVFESVKKLITSAASAAILGQVSDFFKRRRIELAVERAVLAVVEPLTAFLEMEHITPEQRAMLVHAAEQELLPFVLEPSKLFAGSLDGDVMYRQIRKQHSLPEEIRDEQLEAIYELLVPQMGAVLCKLLPVLDEWKAEAWRENFRRFDEMAEMLRKVLGKLDATVDASFRETDALLGRMRRGAAQRAIFRMDLTALRSDAVIGCGFDALFIHPSFTEEKKNDPGHVRNESEALVEFLGAGARAVIVGAAGAGKSTWLRWLERIGNESGWSGIVARIELRSLLREMKLPSYIALLKSAAGAHIADEISSEVAGRWCGAGRIAFLIDGFDEIPAGQRDAILDWILGLVEVVGLCPVVLTSRLLTTDHLLRLGKGWSSWMIDPFDRSRVVEYINRWYEHAELPEGVERTVEAESLAEAWAGDPTIEPLTGNPLLLATLLLVHVLDGSLPAGRAKLYLRYVEGMLGLWDDRQKRLAPKVALTPSQKREILRGIALRMFLAQVEEIEEDEAISMVETVLTGMGVSAGGGDVLDVLRERTGLLVGPGVYSFSHKTVAEFLVAEAIVDGTVRDDGGERVDRMRLFRKRGDDRWTVVCFLWAGLAPAVEFERFVLDLVEGDNTQESWSLVFGLLSDQFERVSKELWEMCVAAFAVFPLKPLSHLNFSAPGLGEMILAPELTLRTLGRGRLGPFLHRAYSRGYLDCLSQGGIRTDINAALRWHIATRPEYGELWRASLRAPELWSEDCGWPMVAGAWSTFSILKMDDGAQAELIAQLSEVWPQCAHELALVILWNVSADAICDADLVAAVRYLAGVDCCRILDSRLYRAKRTFAGFRQLSLDGALSKLQDAVASGKVPNDDLAGRAITCARILVERTNEITASQESRQLVRKSKGHGAREE